MVLKLNISNKGKAWKLEIEPDVLTGKSIGDKIDGKLLKPELEGYNLEITGGTDFAGFPMSKDVEGIGYKRVLLTKGWGMWSKPKGEKKKQPRVTGGLRLRKTVKGKTISEKSIQININVLKEGKTSLEKIFLDQNKPKESEPKPNKKPTEAPAEKPVAPEKPAEQPSKSATEEKTIEQAPKETSSEENKE
ncbi:MAG: S6e family ribosomal protein [Nanoarchaeota archaeon]